jgi:hypothetical protein
MIPDASWFEGHCWLKVVASSRAAIKIRFNFIKLLIIKFGLEYPQLKYRSLRKSRFYVCYCLSESLNKLTLLFFI